MRTSLTDALPYLTIALFGLALLAFLGALRLFRRSRTDAYWRRRREAGRRGLRLMTLAVVLGGLSGLMCAGTLAVSWFGEDEAAPTNTPTALVPSPTASAVSTSPPSETPPTASPAVTAPPLPTAPPETVVVVVTATPAATATPTPFPTFTQEAAPALTQTAATPAEGDGRLSITALDDRISDDLQPINPRVTFVAGTPRIYVFLRYAGMAQGVPWRRALYRDGELLESTEYTWGQDAQGTTYFFFGSAEGFAEGSYEVRVFVGNDPAPAATATFSVLPAP